MEAQIFFRYYIRKRNDKFSGILSGTKSYGKEKINIIIKKKNGKLSETEHSFQG